MKIAWSTKPLEIVDRVGTSASQWLNMIEMTFFDSEINPAKGVSTTKILSV